MVVVILLNDLGTVFDVVGPFETAGLARKWIDDMQDAELAQIGTQFEIEHVSNP
ncbi:hypothetical protein LCGC14_2268430 [marine sediment metagenome]|uniref:Uncharacterized protein n=1 Tax=marine sediment metagenome TaxID=412755 RepID=A0A0F9CXW2_9ZZZZ